jgi:hypothetical protein
VALSAPYKGLWGVGKGDLGVGQGGIRYPQALLEYTTKYCNARFHSMNARCTAHYTDLGVVAFNRAGMRNQRMTLKSLQLLSQCIFDE